MQTRLSPLLQPLCCRYRLCAYSWVSGGKNYLCAPTTTTTTRNSPLPGQRPLPVKETLRVRLELSWMPPKYLLVYVQAKALALKLAPGTGMSGLSTRERLLYFVVGDEGYLPPFGDRKIRAISPAPVCSVCEGMAARWRT